MSMNKVIHGAFRRDIGRVQTALSGFRDGDTARAEEIHRGWRFFDDELTRHHEGEHRIGWPALEAVGIPRSTLETFDQEHEAMAAALADARTAMTTFAASARRSDADAAATAVAHFEQVARNHLEHEESVTEPVFAEHAGHPALKQMGKQYQRDQSLTVSSEFMAWVTDGATEEEMATIRHEIPGPVLALLPKLFGRRYTKEIAPVWR